MKMLFEVKVYGNDGECVSDALLGISSLIDELSLLPVGGRIEAERMPDEERKEIRKMPRSPLG